VSQSKPRQPIVSVLGHVDHGKTTLLDAIRGTKVVSREAGAITQHIGATEVPLEAVLALCGDLAKGKEFTVPGLLFIDTPGHHSFVSLRARGGSLADMAVLVVDINEGFKPQTVESLNILKRFRTPFLVAANKVDLIPGWRRHPGASFIESVNDQPPAAAEALQERLYDLVGKFYNHGFPADRYDKVGDFTETVAVVPLSAKYREGLADVLLMLVGLAQRFLGDQLATDEGPAEGTVLEVKEEKGLGTTLDAIIHSGTLRKGDTLVIGATGPPLIRKVKSILKPKPMDEIRDPRDRFDAVDEVTAASGVKIAARDLDTALAGAPLRVVTGDPGEAVRELLEETRIRIETSDEGVIVKADALGSLEALGFELKEAGIPVLAATIGAVTRRDVVDAATIADPLRQVILAFNVPVLGEAAEELNNHPEVRLFESDVVYRLIQEYRAWSEEKQRELDDALERNIVFPGRLLILPDHTFRVSKPAIVGVRVTAGRLLPGTALLRRDGKAVGKVKSIRSGDETLTRARAGDEVAIAIDGVTVGRQIKEGDVLLTDIPEAHAKRLKDMDLTPDEREVLDEVAKLKRGESPFWGM
jgi:translation initiation factor 5B